MLKIAPAVRNIVFEDEVAILGLQRGIVNLSAYAEEILPRVESATKKKVKRGTVVAALSRLLEEVDSVRSLRPEIILDDIITRAPLCEISFDRTLENQKRLAELYADIGVQKQTFFTVTHGLSEITIICSQKFLDQVLAHFSQKPKAVFTNTVAITVRFSDEYLDVPNVLYTLQAALAVHQINYVEILSTYTEFSFIVEQKYAEKATEILRTFLV